MFDDAVSIERLRLNLVDQALSNEPLARAVSRQIEAQDLEVSSLKRRWWLPRFSLDGTYLNRIAGDGNNELFPFDEFYTIGAGLTYSIAEGGQRKFDIARARSDLDGVTRESVLIQQQVEQRARTALRKCENSFPRIKTTRMAADAGAENLELVREQYAQGLANVTDLVDAQNQAFAAEQVATASVYEFLINLVDLQRAVAWFEDEKTPAEQDAFVEAVTIP
jgi:outer membrane protein TolC